MSLCRITGTKYLLCCMKAGCINAMVASAASVTKKLFSRYSARPCSTKGWSGKGVERDLRSFYASKNQHC